MGMLGSLRLASAFVVGLASAGCAMMPAVWTKADATPDAVVGDLNECHVLADDMAWQMRWERMWPPPFYDPRFMPPFYRAPRAFWLDFPMSLEREQALVDFCMHSKGYRLERVAY
jgi:hypothetical protein